MQYFYRYNFYLLQEYKIEMVNCSCINFTINNCTFQVKYSCNSFDIDYPVKYKKGKKRNKAKLEAILSCVVHSNGFRHNLL